MGQRDESQGFATIVCSERVKTRSTSTEAGDSKLDMRGGGAA